MLNNASDYKFVNTTDVADYINGNILPATHPDVSAVAPAYYEDYLFLLEAYYERQNYDQAGLNNITPANRTLSRTALRGIEFFIPGTVAPAHVQPTPTTYAIYAPDITYATACNWISPNTVIPANQIVTSNTFIYSFITDYSLKNPIRFSPYYDMIPPSGSDKAWRLYGEYIRAKYWLINNMSKLKLQCELGLLVNGGTYYYYDPDGNITNQGSIGLTQNAFTKIQHLNYYQQGQYRIYTNYETILTYRDSISMPYAKAAKLIVMCYQQSISGSGQYTRMVVDLTVSDGKIIIPANLFEDVLSQSCDLCGLSYSQCGVAQVVQSDLIVDFEFPARLNGITYNWQPTYT